MMPATSLSAVFAILEQCAIRGERCPENNTGGVPHGYIPALAHTGWIRVEISGQNYRQIVILKGPYAGKATAPNPRGYGTWKTIDNRGIRVNGAPVVYRAREARCA